MRVMNGMTADLDRNDGPLNFRGPTAEAMSVGFPRF